MMLPQQQQPYPWVGNGYGGYGMQPPQMAPFPGSPFAAPGMGSPWGGGGGGGWGAPPFVSQPQQWWGPPPPGVYGFAPPPPPAFAPPPPPQGGGPRVDAATADAAAAGALGPGASPAQRAELANLLLAWYQAGYYTGRYTQRSGAGAAADDDEEA
jgi:hypothetical protein